MINDEIATIFENMSGVLSFLEASRYRARASRKGGDRFRIIAYQRAALSPRLAGLQDLIFGRTCGPRRALLSV
jgi:hypothetical protein